jgi:hypothetical protein
MTKPNIKLIVIDDVIFPELNQIVVSVNSRYIKFTAMQDGRHANRLERYLSLNYLGLEEAVTFILKAKKEDNSSVFDVVDKENTGNTVMTIAYNDDSDLVTMTLLDLDETKFVSVEMSCEELGALVSSITEHVSKVRIKLGDAMSNCTKLENDIIDTIRGKRDVMSVFGYEDYLTDVFVDVK